MMTCVSELSIAAGIYVAVIGGLVFLANREFRKINAALRTLGARPIIEKNITSYKRN